jgi:hypothetical protein
MLGERSNKKEAGREENGRDGRREGSCEECKGIFFFSKPWQL